MFDKVQAVAQAESSVSRKQSAPQPPAPSSPGICTADALEPLLHFCTRLLSAGPCAVSFSISSMIMHNPSSAAT